MIKLLFKFRNETKTCYRFESRDGGELQTLYLKKALVDVDDIDPEGGIIITVEEADANA